MWENNAFETNYNLLKIIKPSRLILFSIKSSPLTIFPSKLKTSHLKEYLNINQTLLPPFWFISIPLELAYRRLFVKQSNINPDIHIIVAFPRISFSEQPSAPPNQRYNCIISIPTNPPGLSLPLHSPKVQSFPAKRRGWWAANLRVNGITAARWNDYFLITSRQVDYYGIHQLPAWKKGWWRGREGRKREGR